MDISNLLEDARRNSHQLINDWALTSDGSKQMHTGVLRLVKPASTGDYVPRCGGQGGLWHSVPAAHHVALQQTGTFLLLKMPVR
jgi:hypothetical protein